MTSPPKKHGGPRPNSGPKPTAGTPRTVDITSAYTPDEAERLRAIAAGSPLAAVQREAVLARHPEIATGEGGPFRPATPEHTRERDVLRGSSRKRKHRKSGEEGDNG
jgi:hypothetical protein